MVGIAGFPGASAVPGAIVGIGATLLSKFLSLKTWTLVNTDLQTVVQGQFPPNATGREVGGNWVELASLNRQHPILQWLTGTVEKVQVESMFFRKDQFDEAPQKKLNQIIEWTRRQPSQGRPPILQFVLGDGSAVNFPCVLVKVDGIEYSTPHLFGGIQQVKFRMELWRYQEFDITSEQVTDTRYHRVKEGEYYELIAQREYGNALLGDAIRKRPFHRTQAQLSEGDIVQLPAIEGVRDSVIAPTSIAHRNSLTEGVSDQKAVRLAAFERLSGPKVSYLFSPPATAGVVPAPKGTPYIWMAPNTTAGAMVRFDTAYGARAVTNLGNTTAISGEQEGFAGSVVFDKDGLRNENHPTFWANSAGNAARARAKQFDPNIGLLRGPHPEVDLPLERKETFLGYITVDHEGYIWAIRMNTNNNPGGGTEGLIKIDPSQPDAGPILQINAGTFAFARGLYCDKEAQMLFVGSTDGFVAQVDTQTGSFIWTSTGLGISSIYGITRRKPDSGNDPRQLIVFGDNQGISLVNIDTGNVDSAIDITGTQGIRGVAYDPTRDQMWVASHFNNLIFLCEPENATPLRSINLGVRPQGGMIYEPAATSDAGDHGDRVWFDMNNDTVGVIDPTSDPIVLEDTLSVTEVGASFDTFAYTGTDVILTDPDYSDSAEVQLFQPESWFRNEAGFEQALNGRVLVAHYRAGLHNDVDGNGRVTRIVDLSGQNHHLYPDAVNGSGLGPLLVEDDADFNGQPTFDFAIADNAIMVADASGGGVALPFSRARRDVARNITTASTVTSTEFAAFAVFGPKSFLTRGDAFEGVCGFGANGPGWGFGSIFGVNQIDWETTYNGSNGFFLRRDSFLAPRGIFLGKGWNRTVLDFRDDDLAYANLSTGALMTGGLAENFQIGASGAGLIHGDFKMAEILIWRAWIPFSDYDAFRFPSRQRYGI